MPVISLDEMSAIKLMNRVDTKYVLSEAQCMELLRRCADDYSVQVIDGCRACRYLTLYYDTADKRMYTLHHNRQLVRQKIRTRTYVESGVSFVEVKNKTNTGRTKKRRIPIPTEVFDCVTRDAGAAGFLRETARYAPESISPALATQFERITLVNHARTERLTIDLNLRFVNVRARGVAAGCRAERGTADETARGTADATDRTADNRSRGGMCAAGVTDRSLSVTAGSDGVTASIGGMVIVELKQDGMAPSPMKRILADMRVRTLKVSKYCLGTALSDPEVKSNRFKAKIRRITKIVNTKQ